MPDNQNTHLRRLKLEGFKSIKELDLEMRPINILIGANGSGKSNFISLFTFLRYLSEGKLQAYIEKQGYASTFFHFGSKNTRKIVISIEVGYNGYNVEFTHGEANDTLIFENEYCTYSASTRNWAIKGNLGESGLLPDSKATSIPVREYTREYLQKCRVYHFHDTSSSAGFKQGQKISSSSYLYSNANNIAPFLLYLKENYFHSYQDIVSAIKTVAPFFHDFYLEARGEKGDESILLRWLHKDHDVPFSANQLSDGTARFVCLATLFLQPDTSRPNTIVLDEPELGLHPAALHVLAEIVKSVSKKSQVICSTQSVTFANQFEAEDFIVVNQDKGASLFKRLNTNDLKLWLEDYGIGDIWTKNIIGGRPEW